MGDVRPMRSRPRPPWLRAGVVLLLAALLGTGAVRLAWSHEPPGGPGPFPGARSRLADGENPHPIRLVRPPVAPLSAMARLGRRVFFDPGLSSSGRLSCASCHSPQHAYGPPGAGPAMFGGPGLTRQGVRAVPSLRYLERQPNFSIGPDNEENETVSLPQLAAQGQRARRARKTATDTAAAAANLVPQGGLFWDGRADTLQGQAMGPLLSPFEMDGGSVAKVAARLRHASYADRFVQLFGAAVFASPRMTVAEAMFAVARFEIEDPSFHPYTSKFDFWLEGKARFTPAELRGYRLFNDPRKGNCAACHLDRPTRDGRPPLFTDHQFEALGVPRNPALRANRNPAYFDLGLCGPYRTDLAADTRYLRPVPHADPAQRRHPARVLPQRRLSQPAAGAGLLRFPRHCPAEDLPAREGRNGRGIQRPAAARPRQRRHGRSALQPPPGRGAAAHRGGGTRYHCLPAQLDGRLSSGGPALSV